MPPEITDLYPRSGTTAWDSVEFYSTLAASSGKVIWALSSGTDANAPHTYNLSGAELNSGAHAIRIGFSPALVTGAVYDIKIVLTDAYGNTSDTVWIAGITCQPAPEKDSNIYYSVGTTATALYSASGISTSAKGIVELTGSPSTSIGVGDEVRVGAGPDYYYYIRRRDDATHFRLEKCARSSATPGDTNITFSNQAVSIYRAYNTLNGAVNAASVSTSAKDANHLNTVGLVAGGYILNIACYGDGIEVSNAVVDGWTTGASNYLRIFTPTATTEVGTTQRHDGRLDSTSAYMLRCGTTNTNILDIKDDYVRVDGIQIDAFKTGNTGINGINIETGATAEVWVSNCIAKGPLCASTGLQKNVGTGTVYFWNNIVYDWYAAGGANGIGLWTAGGYAYNNTVYACQAGINNASGAGGVLKNNLAYGCNNNYYYVTAFTGTNNLSGPNTSGSYIPATNKRDAVAVLFVDSANNDFRLSGSDVGAKDYGTDLTTDPDGKISFNTDIEGDTRTVTWDIGADDFPFAGGWTADNVIPAAQVTQQTDGSGTIRVNFKIRHPTSSACNLNSFGYSVDGGTTWTTPQNTDNSAGLTGYWPNNGGSGFSSATTLAGATAQSFTLNSKHEDFYTAPTWDDSLKKNAGSPDNPRDIAIYGSKAYVLASGASIKRVYVYDIASGACTDSFGTSGTGAGQFESPQFLCISGGKAYITDKGASSRNVEVWDVVSKTYLTSFTHADWTGNVNVAGIAAHNGKIYVVQDESGNTKLYQFSESDYAFNASSGQYQMGRQMIFADGKIYTAYATALRVHNVTGNDMTYWSEDTAVSFVAGAGATQANGITGITVSGGLIYLAETTNNRIKIIRQSDYSYVTNITSSGSGVNQVSAPNGMCTYNGKLYVADGTNDRVGRWFENSLASAEYSTCKIRFKVTAGSATSEYIVADNFTIDNYAPEITTQVPVAATTVTTDNVQFTLSENLSWGKVIWERAGGNADANSPRVYNLSGTQLNSGAQNITLSFSPPPVKGAVYNIKFIAGDAYGNMADTARIVSVTYNSGGGPIYRSVGPSNTASLADGSGANTLTVVNDSAKFGAALPDTVGVGDVIEYDKDNGGTIDAICFIHGRISSTTFIVKSATGGTPTATTVADDTWKIHRAYTSLYNAERGVENTGVNTTYRNFDDWTVGGDATTDDVGQDLVTATSIRYIACYGDGAVPDNNAVTFDGWNTSASYYITIYTPALAGEVGTTQRHSGVWDPYKYNLTISSPTSHLITLSDNYVRIEGLQLSVTASANSYGGIVCNSLPAGSDVRISSCIIKATLTGSATSCEAIYGGVAGTIEAWNNIVYGWADPGNTSSGIDLYVGSGTAYAYNNTVYNCDRGIYAEQGNTVAKNNLVYSCDDYYKPNSGESPAGAFTGASTNNLCGSTTDGDIPSTGARNGKTVGFTSTSSGSEDLRLASSDTEAKDNGTSLELDANLPFTNDISGRTRPKGTAWDIGAYERDPGLSHIYFSVGTLTSNMYSGNASSTSGILSLSSSAPDSVGIGDEVTKGSSKYYITGRNSSTSFDVQTAAGGSVTDFTSTAITIKRAFNSLNTAISPYIGAGSPSYLNCANLVTGGYILQIACYSDGVDNTAVTVDGWNTDSTHYVRIYTPTIIGEVGTPQRHIGKWSPATRGYTLGVGDATALRILDDWVHIEGIQDSIAPSSASRSAIYVDNPGIANITITNCIIKANGAGTSAVGIRIPAGSGKTLMVSNVIYDFNTASSCGIYASGNAQAAYSFSNTIYNCATGFKRTGCYYAEARNTLLQKCGDGLNPSSPTGGPVWDYNCITDVAEGIPADRNTKNSTTVIFVDSAADNFHLSGSDVEAKDAGLNLSANADYAFSTDIDGESHGSTWDIGADESAPLTNIYYSVGTRTAALYSGNASCGNSLLTLSGSSDTIGAGDEVRVGNNRYYITNRISSSTFGIQNSAANFNRPAGTGINFAEQSITMYRAFNSLRAAIDVTNGNADDAGHLNTSNLGSGNFVLNIACYGDGADTDTCRVDGWTTGASNYIRIYTPTTTSEVGISQRHDGKWKSTGAYILDLPLAEKNALATVEDFVRIEGLQIDASGLTGTIVRGFRSEASASGDVRVSNCIIRGSTPNCNGSGIKSENGTLRAWNNVLYNNGAGIQITTGTAYAYNNTVWGGYNGIKVDGGTMIAKNNLVYRDATTDNYVGTFDASGTNNLSGPVTVTDADMPASNKQDGVDVSFSNAGSGDFRLQTSDNGARNQGASLANDGNIPFAVDNENNDRPIGSAWDIGADEAYQSSKTVYYSIGTTAGFLYSGTGRVDNGVLTITTSTASNTVGLGDEIRYEASKYYIRGRSSSTSFHVQNPSGSDTSMTLVDAAITIYRAFNSLSAAEAGAPGANYLNTSNLVTDGFQLNFVCYGDGADVTATTVDGYTTGPNNYIRIYTPTAATGVGTSQRHAGTWASGGAYTLAISTNTQALTIADEYVRVEGLQISTTSTDGGPNGIYFNPGATPADIRVGYCIIKGILSGTASSAEGILCNANGTYKVYNNIIYDYIAGSGGHTAISFAVGASATAYVYSNTIQACNSGISQAAGSVTAINNIAQSCTDGYSGTFASGSNYNVSNVASDAPGGQSKNGVTVSFVNTFEDNFHLQPTDEVARAAGMDLSGDQNLSFTDDVDTKTRYGVWDIGADQYYDEPGLAVTMDAFFALGGDGNDTISWRTQSEKDNYGFNIFRRIKPAWWVAKVKELTVNGPQLTAGIDARKAKTAKMPVISEGSTSNRSPSTVTSPDTLAVNRSPLTVNLFKDRFDNDTTWQRVNLNVIPGAKGGRSVGPRNYKIIDYKVENGITYEYTIEDIDFDNTRIRHGIAEATPTKRIPKAFALHPNYPNPFNPITVIAYDLPKTCRVDISVYDLRGRRITTLVSSSQVKEAGFYKIVWTGKDTYNRPVASGVYLYRIQAGEFVRLRKMTLLK